MGTGVAEVSVSFDELYSVIQISCGVTGPLTGFRGFFGSRLGTRLGPSSLLELEVVSNGLRSSESRGWVQRISSAFRLTGNLEALENKKMAMYFRFPTSTFLIPISVFSPMVLLWYL